jgi:class 3 adenylate cyclase
MEVATGGSMLDPKIVASLTNPVSTPGTLTPAEESLLDQVAQGTPIKAIAISLRTTPEDVDARIEKLWARLADGVSSGDSSALNRLKALQRAIADREEQGEELSRMLPGGIADKLKREGRRLGETEELEVTVLMSDIRGYSGIAERTDPSALAGQLNRHRAEMNRAILDNGGTVMQFVGDAVMAVFGAPDPVENHADLALKAAREMHAAQDAVNAQWQTEGLDIFGLGLGISTGRVAAALLGSDERIEYTIVGDTVNITQRLQQWAEPGETVLSEPTWEALTEKPDSDVLDPEKVKGRIAPVQAYRFPVRSS